MRTCLVTCAFILALMSPTLADNCADARKGVAEATTVEAVAMALAIVDEGAAKGWFATEGGDSLENAKLLATMAIDIICK